MLNYGDKLFLTYVDVYDTTDPMVESFDPDNPLNVDGFVDISGELYLRLRDHVNRTDAINRGPYLYITEDQLGSTITSMDQLKRKELLDEGPDSLPNIDLFAQTQMELISQVHQWVRNNTGMLPMYMYMYIKADEQMRQHGIEITDENREEKYLEVISKGDDELIDVLAQYLDAQYDMENYTTMLENYKKAVKMIKGAVTLDELRGVCAKLPQILRDLE